MAWRYRCSECGHTIAITLDAMVCPLCAESQRADRPLRGILEVVSGDGIDDGGRSASAPWNLPIAPEHFPPIPVGYTPLWSSTRLGKKLELPGLVLKDDTANPTGSLKDRASYLVAAFAAQHGIDRIVVASTGNAASSMAGVGAAAGLSVVIFVPENAPRAKIAQCLQYGAEVIAVEGSYDRAYELSLDYSRRHRALSRNTAYNPLTIEGKKTAAIEIVQDLGRSPDFVFLPAGDGVILSGIYKGFRDLRLSGTIADIPTVVAVQAEGSNALARAFDSGDFSDSRPSRTVADSIAADVPRAGYYALKNLRQFGGRCVTVSDDAILESQLLLASYSGLFAEPAAAASLAGLVKIRDQIPPEASVVLLITGSGLKDVDAALRKVDFNRVSRQA